MKFENLFKIILLIIGIGVLILTFWNLFTLKNLSKTKTFKDTQLNDSKYFELKYKLEFLVATFTLIIGIVSFLGYNSYNTLKEGLNSEMKLQVDSTIKSLSEQKRKIDTLRLEIDNQTQKVFGSNELIRMIEKEQQKLKSLINVDQNSVQIFRENIETLKERISKVQNKNIIKQELYIVKDLSYPLSSDWIPRKYEFKDLRTVNNEKLPSFKDSPIIIPFTNDGFSYVVSRISNTSFQITAIGNSHEPNIPNEGRVSLLISIID